MSLEKLHTFAFALVVLLASSMLRAGDAPAPAVPPPAAPAAAAAATPSGAVPPAPTAAEIKKVSDYYLNGAAGGPVLMEFTACAKVGKTPEGKLACEAQLGTKAKKDDALIAFVRFFVPKGANYDDLKIRFMLDGAVRSTSSFTLSESWTGYASYKQTNASKAGRWEMQVLRGEALLASATVTVE